MPRVSPEHEREARARIAAAALRVFSEKGFYRATMQDVVRESGVSVGAIYTYFSGKDELILAACAITTGQDVGELAGRLTMGRTTAEKLAIAVGFFLDVVDAAADLPGMGTFLVQAWAEADREPAVREMLIRRREQILTVGQMLIHEAVAGGEIPGWADTTAVAAGVSALLDGILLMRIEEGPGYRRDAAERRVRAVLELMLAAPAHSPRPSIPTIRAAPSRTPSSVLPGDAELDP